MDQDLLNGKPLSERFSKSFETFSSRSSLPKNVLPFIWAIAVLLLITFGALYNHFVINTTTVVQTNLRQNAALIAGNIEFELNSLQNSINRIIVNSDKEELQVENIFAEFPEVVMLRLLLPNGKSRQSWVQEQYHNDMHLLKFNYLEYPQQLRDSIATAFNTQKPTYSSYWSRSGDWSTPAVALVVPFTKKNGQLLAYMARISLNRLLEQASPKPKNKEFEFSIVHGQEFIAGIASFNDEKDNSIPSTVMPISPLPSTMQLFGAKVLEAPLLFSSPLMLWLSVLIFALLLALLFLTVRTEKQKRKLLYLDRENKLYQSIEYSMTVGIIVCDMDFRIIFCNGAVQQITGYRQDELLDKKQPWPFLTKKYLTKSAFTQNNFSRDKDLRFDIRITRADDKKVNCAFLASPFYSSEKKQIGWLCTLRDNTAEAKGQHLINDTLTSYRKLLNSVSSCISLVQNSPSGGILGIRNTIYTKQLGNSIDGHLAISRAFTVPFNTDGQRHETVWVESLDRWFNVNETRVRLTEGTLVTMQVALDVTTAKKAEESLETQARKMEISSRLITLGEMASTITHEINQPLTAISTYSNTVLEIIHNNPESLGLDRIEEVLTKISTQSKRIERIIQNIRSFSQRKAAVQTKVAIPLLVNDTMELAQMTEKRHRVKIITNIEANLPFIECDRMQIFQVLLNLIRNAADAINGHKSLDRRIFFNVRLQQDKRHVLFEVADHGPGISDTMKKNIWTPFLTTKSGGLGLGLPICRSIIESHSSRLLVRDNDNGGVIFYFELKVADDET